MKEADLVWRLLRKNISVAQSAGYAVANLVGLSIVMIAVQFYRDADSFISGRTADNSEYITVSKRVGAFGLSDTRFSGSEIDTLRSQPWVADVGQFTASRFNVNAAVDFNGNQMSTALFFESVPDRFLDIVPAFWTFEPGDTEIPIIMSKDYLSLYNFGFAAARGLPTVSEAMIGMVPLRVSVSGNGRQQYFRGRIVGFSSRLNTIAVPEQFMQWANATFGEGDDSSPSRLIVEVSDRGGKDVKDYLESHSLDVGAGMNTSQNRFILSVLVTVVAGIGAVICLLSLFILMLSLHLLMQKNGDKIHSLMLLGYEPRNVAAYYSRLVAMVNIAVFAASSVVMIAVVSLLRTPFAAIGAEASSPLPAIVIGLAVIAAVTTVNLITINRKVRSRFY